MRISDWSSDVCSSDLADIIVANAAGAVAPSDNEPPGAEELVRRLGFGPRPVAGIAGGKKARQCGFAGIGFGIDPRDLVRRSEEHTSELQSLMRISYAVFCLKTKTRLTE